MLTRARITVSLDGFVATPGGWPTVDLNPRSDVEHDDPELTAPCGGIVWGRTGFDQGFSGGWESWPWPDQKVYVLTSRPLPDQARKMGVVAADGPKQLVELLRAGHKAGDFTGDVHVVGGGKAIQSMLRAGAIDRLQLLVLPILVGTGVPLFELHTTEYSTDAWTAAAGRPARESLAHPVTPLELHRHRSYDDGVIELVYVPGNRPSASPD